MKIQDAPKKTSIKPCSEGCQIELFYLNSTLNFGIPIVFVFQLEVYYKTDRLLTGLTAQPKGTTARWYSNKTSLVVGVDVPLP